MAERPSRRQRHLGQAPTLTPADSTSLSLAIAAADVSLQALRAAGMDPTATGTQDAVRQLCPELPDHELRLLHHILLTIRHRADQQLWNAVW